MRVEKKKIEFPDRKISETFLDYSSPLLDALGEHPTKYQVEQVLKIAFTVWNAIVLDSVKGGTEYISLVRDTVKKDLMSSALIEQMTFRKNDMFSGDHRMIGEYSITQKNGEWRLRAEARDPSAMIK